MSTPINNNETPNGKEYKNELSKIIEEPNKPEKIIKKGIKRLII